MLGDLRDKLEPIGKLDALGGVGSRVLAYYSKQDTLELSDAGLLQRSRALSLTAQVANLRGDMDTAEQLYRQALQGTAEAVRRDPDDPQRLFDHAQNVFWLGDIARDRGQIDKAEAANREYKRLADRMVAIEPDNLKWRMEVLYAEENIGIVLRNQRRFVESARQFESSLRPMQSLASIDPGNAEYQRELSTLLAWSADAERDLGRIDAAIHLRERQISFLRGLLASGDTNVAFRQHLIPAHQGLGILFASRGQPDRGIEQFRLGVAEANRLIQIEPDNILWKGLAGQAQLELARTLLSLGQDTDARTEAQAACRLAAQVHARDPGRSWRHLQTDCLGLRSRLALQSAAEAEALKLAELALVSAKSERGEDPTRDRYRIAAAHRLIGDTRLRMGDSDAARDAWTAGFDQLPRNVAERPAEMQERAEILKRLGRSGEASAITAKLSAIGFRRTI
jgi:tetratricopeptide (TPR) repeat protein